MAEVMTAPARPVDGGRVQRWLFRPADPRALAAFRVAVFVGFGLSYAKYPTSMFADLPDELEQRRPFLGPVLEVLPRGATVGVLSVVMAVACVSAIVGYRSRMSAAVATAAGFYVLGVPVLFGHMSYPHHLLWFGLLLALSPCGDAWSIDALRRGARPEPSAVYGFPLQAAALLMGLAYLSAGLPKLVHLDDWVFGNAVRDQLYGLWYVADIDPVGWMVDTPLLARAVGLAVIVFEVGFLPAVLFARTRLSAVACGIVFHTATALVMQIQFWHLVVCYVALIPWAWDSRSPDEREPGHPVVLAGLSLIVAMVAMVPAQRWDGFPVASYPDFPRAGGFVMKEPQLVVAGQTVTAEDVGLPWRHWRGMLTRATTDPTLRGHLVDVAGEGPWQLFSVTVHTRDRVVSDRRLVAEG